MSKADKSAVRWLCVAALLLCVVIAILVRAGCGAITHPVDAGISCAAVVVFAMAIAAILFGLATETI